MVKYKIKDWETLTGIKLRNTNGFKIPKNKVYNKLFTKREFRRGAKKSNITVNTEKGLNFILGVDYER